VALYRVPQLMAFSFQPPVLAMQNSPPGSPTKGDRYVITTPATGAWTGKEKYIATWDGSAWIFDQPSEGWIAYNIGDATRHRFSGTAWILDLCVLHASTHQSGGADAIALDILAVPTDITTLNATTSLHGLLPKLGGGTTNFLRADGTWAAPGGGSGADVSYFRKAGTGTYEAWYSSPRSGTALAGAALTINRLYAMPFICPKGITVDRIGVYVSTSGVSAHGTMGIYDDTGIYPASLVIDAGEIDASSTGAKVVQINQSLVANKLYWLVYLCDVAHSIYCIQPAGIINVLGTSNALGTAINCGLYVSRTYGTLPDTFPGSPTLITASPIPCIFVRLSS
jgi:hypothetical protein